MHGMFCLSGTNMQHDPWKYLYLARSVLAHLYHLQSWLEVPAMNIEVYLADPGKARSCFTNTVVIHKLIN